MAKISPHTKFDPCCRAHMIGTWMGHHNCYIYTKFNIDFSTNPKTFSMYV